MNKKIIFFDIDGTLYDPEIGVPSSTKEAIHSLISNGHIPIICTGRTKAMVPNKFMDIGFFGIIAGAGTYVEYQGNLIHNKVYDGAFAKKVLPLFHDNDVSYIVEGPEYIYYNTEDKKRSKRDIQFITNAVDKDKIKVINYDDMQMNKITCIFPDEIVMKKLVPKLKEHFDLIHHQGTNLLELVPHGYSKATGIMKLTTYLNIDRQNTYAFGDSSNDLEMLDYVQYGVAMGNSYPEILEQAEYTTKSIKEDGIYYGLKEFGLI